jgi:uncharacterized protein with FMN-binding domain
MNHPPKLHPALAALIVIALISVATAGVVELNKQSSLSSQPGVISSPPAVTSTSNSSAPSSTATYKDGTYTATASYLTPGGTESIRVQVALAGNAINDVQLSQQGDSRESQEYQAAFAGEYQSSVAGKNITEVKLSRVAGSSLTSNAFNEAIDQIKRNAAA